MSILLLFKPTNSNQELLQERLTKLNYEISKLKVEMDSLENQKARAEEELAREFFKPHERMRRLKD